MTRADLRQLGWGAYLGAYGVLLLAAFVLGLAAGNLTPLP